MTDDDIQLSDALIHTRQHIGPKHLVEPAPDAATLRELFAAAAATPDHGQLRPWRFLVLGNAARQALSDVFVEALLACDPDALPNQIDDARKKAFCGPVLIMAITDLRAPDEDVAPFERLISLGCAIQNLLLAARARGYGSGLSGGRALRTNLLQKTLIELGEAPIDLGQGLFDLGEVPIELGQGLFDLGQVPIDLGQGLFDLGEASIELGQGLFALGEVPIELGQGLF